MGHLYFPVSVVAFAALSLATPALATPALHSGPGAAPEVIWRVDSPAQNQQHLKDWGGAIRAHLANPDIFGGFAAVGEVVCMLEVAASGEILAVSISRSSGNAEFDQEIAQRLGQAGPFPKAPDQLGIESHKFKLPIRIEPSEETPEKAE